jgi:hypothetical protein
VIEKEVRLKVAARVIVWVKLRIFIPYGNRCCKIHLSDGKFKEEAMQQIKAVRGSSLMTGKMVSSWLSSITDVFSKPRRILDFELPSELTNDDYEMILGVSRANFDILIGHCQSSIKRSRNRFKFNFK